MFISLIAAISENNVIGQNNKLPWHIPEDLQWFKTHTVNKPIVMGRKTYESIGHDLPNRINVVLSRNTKLQAPNCIVVDNKNVIFDLFKNFTEVMIIGGEEIYKIFLPHANRLYLTMVEKIVEGDVFFPSFEKKMWSVKYQSSHILKQQNLKYEFLIMEK